MVTCCKECFEFVLRNVTLVRYPISEEFSVILGYLPIQHPEEFEFLLICNDQTSDLYALKMTKICMHLCIFNY
jgi:hypothetical protein